MGEYFLYIIHAATNCLIVVDEIDFIIYSHTLFRNLVVAVSTYVFCIAILWARLVSGFIAGPESVWMAFLWAGIIQGAYSHSFEVETESLWGFDQITLIIRIESKVG